MCWGKKPNEHEPPPPRAAGQHARETGKRFALGYAAVAFAASAACLFGIIAGLPPIPLSLIAITAIGLCIAIDRYRMPLVDRWLQGARGEEKVGKIIAGLEAGGWKCLHDRCISKYGNVDHILVGPGGLFTIETKSHRGTVYVDKIDKSMTQQARLQAKDLHDVTGKPVEPLLVFSDAFIKGQNGKGINRFDGVLVLPGRMLAGHLGRRRVVLSALEIDDVYARLDAALA